MLHIDLCCFIYWRLPHLRAGAPIQAVGFPPPKEGDGIIGFKIPLDTTQDQVDFSELVIEGTVKEVKAPFQKTVSTLTPDGHVEEAGGLDWDMTYYTFIIQVDDIMKGSVEGDTIEMCYSSFNAASQPDLKEGQRMIFCLVYNDYWNNYNPISDHSGYYYIARDNRVYPVDPSGPISRTSGMDLQQLKDEMRSYAGEEAEK